MKMINGSLSYLFLDIIKNILWSEINSVTNKYLFITLPHNQFNFKKFGIIINPHPKEKLDIIETDLLFEHDELRISFNGNTFKVQSLNINHEDKVFEMIWIDETSLTENEKIISLKGILT